MSEWAVSNSACLIGLERINRFDILEKSFDAVFIPPAVQKEIGYTLDWLIVKPVHNVALAKTLMMQIGEGESETIALAAEMQEVFVVLDDKKARRLAQPLGLKVIGTVGVLLRAKKRGVIPAIKPVLDAFNEVDFRIGVSLYYYALQLANEK